MSYILLSLLLQRSAGLSTVHRSKKRRFPGGDWGGVPIGNQSMTTGNLALQCSGSKEAGYWGSVVEKSKHWTGIDGLGSKAQE